jgi:hypothetical protein
MPRATITSACAASNTSRSTNAARNSTTNASSTAIDTTPSYEHQRAHTRTTRADRANHPSS